MADNSFFLVLEGSDGSGKGTQQQLLVDRLRKEGYEVETFDFPRYSEPSSHFVREYLNGTYGTVEEVGPYTASMFYALDRYETAPRIKEALEAGKIVIANRYTGSNMAHQGTKFNNTEERKGYFLWLDAIEFQMLRIPRPNVSLVLRVPAETAQKMVDKKGERSYTTKKRDLHEADINHLRKAVEVYDNLCELFPKDFKALDCTRDGELIDKHQVHSLIWESIQPLLPSAPQPKRKPGRPPKTKYHVPSALDQKLKQTYTSTIDKILKLQRELTKELAKFENNPEQYTQDVLPIAADTDTASQLLTSENGSVEELAHSKLTSTYSTDSASLKLVSAAPRNEFAIVGEILYPYSTQPAQEINNEIAEWSYNDKATALEEYLAQNNDRNVLDLITYTWDILSDYRTYRRVSTSFTNTSTRHQLLTPRHGYEIPKAIQEANLSDHYEECFDASLKLYSVLQSAGFDKEAQLATLNGHKLRWQITFTAKQLEKALDALPSEQLLRQILDKTREVHPVIAESMRPA